MYEMKKNLGFLFVSLLAVVSTLLSACSPSESKPRVHVAEVVSEERATDEYQVLVEGEPLQVHVAGVSKDVQRPPLSLDADYYFSSFDFSGGAVEVEIRCPKALAALSVHSVAGSLPVRIVNGVGRFELAHPGQYLIERNDNGRKDPLLLFANEIEKDVPSEGDAGVVFYGPGFHEAGLIQLSDNQTLYLAPGAVVNGRVEAQGDNITIRGRGLLENSGEEHNWKYIVSAKDSTNFTVEGITIRKHTRGWTLVTKACEDVLISNVKIVGSHSYNDDGIDLCHTRRAVVENCFVRTNDDCFAFKGMDRENLSNIEDIEVRGCMFWSDLCTAILLVDESHSKYMRNITFRDCLVPYLSYEKYPKKFLMIHSCEEMKMENILIENFQIGGEGQAHNYIEIASEFNQWCETERAGSIDGILLKNIHLTGPEGSYKIVVKGFDDQHRTRNVTFENCTINGKVITADYLQLEVGDFVEGLEFVE